MNFFLYFLSCENSIRALTAYTQTYDRYTHTHTQEKVTEIRKRTVLSHGRVDDVA